MDIPQTDRQADRRRQQQYPFGLRGQGVTRTTRTPAFWGYPRRLMITHTIESCWIPSQNKVQWPWRYRSGSKVITCDTPSHASDHLYQIWKESTQNCRRYRADTIIKVKAEWPGKYRSRSKVITWDTPSDVNDDMCQIWKECKQNCRFFFKVKAEKFVKFAKNWNFIILLETSTRNTPSNGRDYLWKIWK